MVIFKKYIEYIKELWKLALPMIGGNFGFMLLGLGDILVAGRHSTNTLASISIANAISVCIFMVGLGFIASVSPILSNLRGARKSAKKYFYPTLRVAFLISVIVSSITFLTVPFIPYIGLPDEIVSGVQEYLFIITFSIFGGYIYAALREYLQAFEIVMFPNMLTLSSVIVNLILNYIFVFGWGAFPSLGTKGIALATCLVRTLMGLCVYLYCIYNFRITNYHPKKYYEKIFKIGLPISLSILIEFTTFNVFTVLLGRISAEYAAAQNILINIISIAFMISLSFSNALSIKIGFANGAKNYLDLKRYAKIGIALVAGFMSLCGFMVAIWGCDIARIFTKDEALIEIIAPLTILAGCFHTVDGLQCVLGGIFKGLKKTKAVMLAGFIGYFCVTFIFGCYLAFVLKLYLTGLWIALFCGSSTICLILGSLLFIKFKKLPNIQEC